MKKKREALFQQNGDMAGFLFDFLVHVETIVD
jgi:hypothetical protein